MLMMVKNDSSCPPEAIFHVMTGSVISLAAMCDQVARGGRPGQPSASAASLSSAGPPCRAKVSARLRSR
jgi:hypothetical protein